MPIAILMNKNRVFSHSLNEFIFSLSLFIDVHTQTTTTTEVEREKNNSVAFELNVTRVENEMIL